MSFPLDLSRLIAVLVSLSCLVHLNAQPVTPGPKFPDELVKFVPLKNEPIFTGGGKGKWDERIRERGWIMRDGGIYKMWYTGYTGTPGEILKLGYATSDD